MVKNRVKSYTERQNENHVPNETDIKHIFKNNFPITPVVITVFSEDEIEPDEDWVIYLEEEVFESDELNKYNQDDENKKKQ